MALIKCKECGMEFNSNLEECPNCGCPASECEEFNDNIIAKDNEVSINESNLTLCKDCGAKISLDAKRCPHCGAKGKYASLDYGNAIYDCFCRKYFKYSGRSRRSEVFPFLVLVGMLWVIYIFTKPDWILPGLTTAVLLFLITVIPVIGACVRRLHDAGHSGWWLGCPVVAEIFMFKDSDKVENEYGMSPKYQPEFNEELPDRGTFIGQCILFALLIYLVAVIIFFYIVIFSM